MNNVVARPIVSKRMPWAAFLVFAVACFIGCSEKAEFNKPNAPPNQTAANREMPAGGGNINDARERPATVEAAVIPSGRVLTVRLLQTISSRTASPGQHFEAELAAPIVVDGRTVLPRGTPLRGRVVAAQPSGRLHNPGYLRLTLSAIQTPNGRWTDLSTTSISAKGASHKKRNLALIGGGSGVGAAIGAIAGGGKGAAIGAATGAGAGTAGAYATGKKDVSFAAERKLSFRTTQEVRVGQKSEVSISSGKAGLNSV